MAHVLRIAQVRVHRLGIPMRLRFEHAAARRATADPIVVELVAAPGFGDLAGFGETLARAYVTGETAETVVDDLLHVFVPELLQFRAESFAEAVEFADALPVYSDGRLVNAARAGVELALLDLAGRAFGRRAAEACAWLELPGFAGPGALASVQYSGMVVGRKAWKRRAMLRLQRAYGLRDFKLKVAVEGWEAALADAGRILRPRRAAGPRGGGGAEVGAADGGAGEGVLPAWDYSVSPGGVSLRVDANGAWTFAEALAALPQLAQAGVSALEQPLAADRDGELPALALEARRHGIALMPDESLRTVEDAERLIEADAADILNVRVAKCGGLLPAWRMAGAALAAGRGVQLGCLVGETSILSSAGLAFLEMCPRVRFAEGCFGRWLLNGDVVQRPVQFGWRGRVRARRGLGLGVDVEAGLLETWRAGAVIAARL